MITNQASVGRVIITTPMLRANVTGRPTLRPFVLAFTLVSGPPNTVYFDWSLKSGAARRYFYQPTSDFNTLAIFNATLNHDYFGGLGFFQPTGGYCFNFSVRAFLFGIS